MHGVGIEGSHFYIEMQEVSIFNCEFIHHLHLGFSQELDIKKEVEPLQTTSFYKQRTNISKQTWLTNLLKRLD